MAKRKKRKGKKAQQMKFKRAAKKCAKKKGKFQACMRKELKK